MNNNPTLTVVQRLVLPTSSGLGLPENLYHAVRHRAVFRTEDSTLEVLAGGRINLFSYFNAFELGHWRRVIDPSSIGLSIGFSGEVTLTVELHRSDSGKSVVFERRFESGSVEECDLEGIFANLGAVKANEIASVVLSSERGCVVLFCDWFTTQQAMAGKKVGIVITHFNRQQWVLPAIERFKRELLADPNFSGCCELVVVDNSQNLDLANSPGLLRVPSPNYGCSGGFAKGLSYLAESGKFTHAVFMDDDATCEIESIKRIINFYQFSDSERLAISGALFCEPNFDRIYEAGASWGSGWQPRHHNEEAHGRNLHEIGAGTTGATYGGWWCFGFPISKNLKWPFPFFVRGDDVSFSLSNGFEIVCPLGVACWAESFQLKDGPWLKYLDGRMHTMPVLVFKTATFVSWIKSLTITVIGCLQCYRYAAAEMFLAGIRDSLKPKDFWETNADAVAIRKRYFESIQAEQYQSPDAASTLVARDIKNEPWVRKLIRRITLGGHLLPKIALKKNRVLVNKRFCNYNKLIFPYYKVRLLNNVDAKAWDTERSVFRAAKVLCRLFFLYPLLISAYYFNAKHFKAVFDELTSKQSWDERFDRG